MFKCVVDRLAVLTESSNLVEGIFLYSRRSKPKNIYVT